MPNGGINLAKAQSYQSDTFQINGKIINALIGKLNDNNIYLMHLQQGKQVDFEELKRHQSQNESQVGRQINEIQDRCSFLQHYSYAQEVTDILNGDLNKNPLKIKVYSSSQNDYIDQFLWNSPLSDVYNQIPPFHHQGPSLMQEQKFIHLEQPSLGPIIKQKQSNNIPLFPTVSSLENEVSELSKDYRKNLAGYIVKKVLRLLLSPTFSTRLARLCQRYSVDLAACRQYIQSTLPRVFGPNSIYELFTPRNFQQRGMKEMLVGLVEKTLRKRYTVEILREGRMKDYEAYIGVKNRGLLYFSQLLG